MEQRLDGGVGSRKRRGVGCGRPSPGAGRPALEREDRLAAGHAAGDPAEPPRVPEGLEVQDHDVRALVVLPVLEQVVRRDVGLVPDGHEGGESEAAPVRLVEEREAERAALGAERDVPGRELRSGERAIEGRVGERDADAVRPEQACAVGADEREQLVLARHSLGAELGEARGDHADRSCPMSKDGLDDLEHRGSGNADEREIDGSRQILERCVSVDAVHRDAAAIDRIDGAGKARCPEVADERAADRARLGRRTDDRDARRREERPQGFGDCDMVALVAALEVGGRLGEAQLDPDLVPVAVLRLLEACLREDVQHRRVLGEHVGDEALDTRPRSERGELLEEARPDPAALELVRDDKRDLGRVGIAQPLEGG